MNIIENLEWRYATKKFDPEKKVDEETIEKLKKAIQLSASSYGLQPYKILIIEDEALKKKLQPASWNQSQIVDCSHLFVFCSDATITDELTDDYVKLKAEVQSLDLADLQGYGDFVKKKLSEKSGHEKASWTTRQAYIALANLLVACAELKIDACPMEGFEPSQYDEILNLSEQGLKACALTTVGYRSENDTAQHQAKVRKPMEILFEKL